ncbi:hypothetical protein [Sphingobacterium multivorum]|uniref:hypothetical protein n=1 Tax=Sphingobacterium multivorum TaxID=28454 RepID=UPI0031BB1EB3
MNYYLYYRCVNHTSINIPGKLLHERYNLLIEHLSFNQQQVNELIGYIKDELAKVTKVRSIELKSKKLQLKETETKLERLEDKVLNDIINGETYQKGYKRFSIELARLKSEITDLSVDIVGKVKKQIELIPQLLNIPELFKRATINEKHSILNRVFKEGLTFENGDHTESLGGKVFKHTVSLLYIRRMWCLLRYERHS